MPERHWHCFRGRRWSGRTVAVIYAQRLIEKAIVESQQNESTEAEATPEPGTAESDEGCIYCVDGANTESAKDYVGSADDLDKRAETAKDGRDRSNAKKIDSYKKGDRVDRQNKEQKAMNERGGKENLDNKRNEVAPKKVGRKRHPSAEQVRLTYERTSYSRSCVVG